MPHVNKIILLPFVLLFFGCSNPSTNVIEKKITNYLLEVDTMPSAFCGNSLMGGKAREIKSVEIKKQSDIKEHGNYKYLVVMAYVEGTCTTNMPVFYRRNNAKPRGFVGTGEFIVYEDDYGDWQVKGK